VRMEGETHLPLHATPIVIPRHCACPGERLLFVFLLLIILYCDATFKSFPLFVQVCLEFPETAFVREARLGPDAADDGDRRKGADSSGPDDAVLQFLRHNSHREAGYCPAVPSGCG